jgi:hypothetical protein
MLKRHEDKLLFFSTKVELKISGTVYRPSICYKVPALAKASLEKQAALGKVTFYTSPVRFVNGIVKYPPAEQAVAGVASVNRSEEVDRPKRKKGK